MLLCGERSGGVSAWTGAPLQETWRSSVPATGGVALAELATAGALGSFAALARRRD